MREIDGMTYADLANALDVTVPAVKSLLVRARVGLVEAAEARDADCAEIQADLLRAYDRGVKASGRARKHMRSCDSCTEYRGALRGMRRSFAALAPVGVGPLAFAAKLIGLGGSAAGGAAASGGGTGAVVAGGGLATATACKVAAVVCTAAIATGGAVEVNHQIAAEHAPTRHTASTTAGHSRPALPAPAPISAPVRTAPQATTVAPAHTASVSAPATRTKDKPATQTTALKEKKLTSVPVALERTDIEAPAAITDPQVATGGTRAPDATATPTAIPTASPAPVAPTTSAPQATPAPATTSEQPGTQDINGGAEAPAPADAAPPAGG
jgi:hypothetical protein